MTGRAASQSSSAGSALPLISDDGESDDSDSPDNTKNHDIFSTDDTSDDSEEGISAAGSAALGFGIAIIAVAAIVAIAFAARRPKAGTAADEVDTEAADRRTSFEAVADAVSESGTSLGSVESMDVIPAYEEPDAAFEQNGFVLQDDNTVRVKSVHRGNPAYRSSVYTGKDVVSNQDTIETDSAM